MSQEPNDQVSTIDVAAKKAAIELAVGRGLSSFSGIESHLALIFARCIRTSDQVLALIAFDAIGLTAPKIRVLKAVAKCYFEREALYPTQWQQRLEILLKRVSARTDVRVKLAHWTVSLWSPEGMPISNFSEPLEARLVPPWFSSKNLSFDPTESLTVGDIDEFIAKCNDVSNQLLQFFIDLDQI